jgi:serine/threonine-protein kinase
MIQRATIIDFGIAKDADTNKKTVIGAGFGGKLGFAAPEAFGLFGRKIGAWTDIYSLALVIAAAARGRVIDMGTATPIDAIRARQSVPELDGVEPWLAAVLARMLEPDPDDRFRTMTAVIAAIDALPPVGTPFDAEAAAGLLAALPTLPREATIPPGPVAAPGGFVRADDARETTDLRLVRAPTSTTGLTPEKPKSKLPLLIGGGVGLAAIVGIALAFSGGDSAPEAAEGTAAAPEVAAAAEGASAATDWAAARAALAAIPCSDIRATPPAAGATTLAVSGWMAAGTAVPQTAGGFRIDGSGVRPVSPAPSARSCATIDRLKQAAGDGGAIGSIALPAIANWTITQLQVADGYAQVPIGLGALTKPLFIVNIDDGATDPAKQLVAAPLPAGVAALPYAGRDPVRYLQFFLTAPTLPGNGAETGDGAAIAKACAAGCESTSGWVVLR